MMMNRRIVLASRPKGVPVPENFRLIEEPVAAPGEGEVLIENLLFAIDPAIRGFLDDRESYMPPVQIGGLIKGGVLGRIIQSRNPAFPEGGLVRGFAGWEEYSVLQPEGLGLELLHINQKIPLSAYMGALGWSGITAYVGLHAIGQITAGETVVVSGASGAVGGVAGQIAKLRGCRAVGIVGTAEKARIAVDQLGFDAAVNYRAEADLGQAIKAACPKGADIYFDNVGGRTLDTMLPLMSDFGRIVVCGMIANYNNADDPYPIRNLWQVLVKRLTMRGFLTFEHPDMIAGAEHMLTQWILSGELKPLENVTTGIENTPAAFIRLMSGQTSGKTLVRLNDSVKTLS